MKMLFISPFIPYDNVGHAGGKTHNYYLKKFHQSEEFDVKLITFATLDEVEKHDLGEYGIDYKIIVLSRKFGARVMRFFWRKVISLNIFDKKGAFVAPFYQKAIKQSLKQLKEKRYYPDIILLEWTQFVLLIDEIKKIYPSSYYVVSEHDVSFLTMDRGLKFKRGIKKFLYKNHLKNEKKSELYSLKLSDLVVTQNVKDKDLLLKNGINSIKIYCIVPYYTHMFDIIPSYAPKNIIFFGAMNRGENYLSVIWFIENVFKKIIKMYPESKLFVVGNKPPDKLINYSSDNIIVTGFVKNPQKYFEKSSCMVCPLVSGGGIKVKVLEGMSAGLPVITNDIGIEGIPARDRMEYLHAETPEEYIALIKKLFEEPKLARQIGEAGRVFVKMNFDFGRSFEDYKARILKEVHYSGKHPSDIEV